MGGLTLSTADKFKQLSSSVENLAEEFKAELADGLVSVVDFLQSDGVPTMRSALDFAKDSISAIKTLNEQFDAINITLVATAGAISGLALSKVAVGIGAITNAIKTADKAQKAFNLTSLANPWVAGVAVMATAAYAGKIKWDEWGASDITAKNNALLASSDNPASRARAEIESLKEQLAGLRRSYLSVTTDLENTSAAWAEFQGRGVATTTPMGDENDKFIRAIEQLAEQQEKYSSKIKESKSALEADISAKQREADNAYALYLQRMTHSASLNNGRKDLSSLLKVQRAVNQANAQFGIYENLKKEIDALNYELSSPTYKYSLAERTQMQQQLKEAEVALINTKQDARTSLTGSFLGSSTLASLVPDSREIIMSGYSPEELDTMKVRRRLRSFMGPKYRDWTPPDVMSMLMGDKDVASNTEMIRTMLPLIEAAGFRDFDLAKTFNAAQNDPQKLLEAYGQQQDILQGASGVYEQLYKDARSESINTKLTVEEQMAAFERFQESFNTYLEIQEQILANTQTIADIEKQNFSKSMANDLSDALTVFAEAMDQTNKTEIYYQSLSAQEILAKLKAALKESNPANADSLIFAINELEELDLWG